MTTRLLVGDVRARIAEIGDGSVDLVVTSPPFLALRKYGDDDAEMGSEGSCWQLRQVPVTGREVKLPAQIGEEPEVVYWTTIMNWAHDEYGIE